MAVTDTPDAVRSILIVEDDADNSVYCARLAVRHGYFVNTRSGVQSALEILVNSRIDVVLCNIDVKGGGGLALLKAIKDVGARTQIVMMCHPHSVERATSAVRQGASDYITIPIQYMQFVRVLDSVCPSPCGNAGHNLNGNPAGECSANRMVGTSPAMKRLRGLISKAAGNRWPVLICGESGTGKELVARAIHEEGPWAKQPFVPIDCGELTSTLIESEIFGHTRGAFTGASESREGLLACANGGTVLLDEIGELPLELQPKFLRVLQEGEIRPLGSNKRILMKARIVAATNRDLEAAVKEGKFRQDLFFRLDVISIRVPPLRERREDIPDLIAAFMKKHRAAEMGFRSVSKEAIFHLTRYDWPGNVRQLENCILRALVLGSPPELEAADLPLYTFCAEADRCLSLTLQEMERRAVLQALETTKGDRVRAARLLGIGKTTIYRKLKELSLLGHDWVRDTT